MAGAVRRSKVCLGLDDSRHQADAVDSANYKSSQQLGSDDICWATIELHRQWTILTQAGKPSRLLRAAGLNCDQHGTSNPPAPSIIIRMSHPLPLLFDSLPKVLAESFDPERPWDLLGDPLDEILDALPSSAIEIALTPDAHLVGDRIAIGAGTRIYPGAVIEGPVWIGRDVQIRPGAYLRPGNWIGDGSIVGTNTEVKRSIFLPGARAPHKNYVGDSVLGSGVNLGAGTVLANFRHDGAEIRIPLTGERLSTGRRKLGAILGDRVLTGCGVVLHPGVVLGQGSQIYPGTQLRPGLYPADCIVKLRQQIEIVSRDPDS